MDVSELAADAGTAANSVLEASNEFSEQAYALRKEVTDFLEEVKAG